MDFHVINFLCCPPLIDGILGLRRAVENKTLETSLLISLRMLRMRHKLLLLHVKITLHWQWLVKVHSLVIAHVSLCCNSSMYSLCSLSEQTS
jgi:hypothetical protein